MLVTGVMLVLPDDSQPMKEKMKAKTMERIVTPTDWPYWSASTRQEKNALMMMSPVHCHQGTCSWAGAGS